jgi:hypothetical protein
VLGKLAILGAQRVKALTEMLKEKEQLEIKVIQTEMKSEDEINQILEQEYGIEEEMHRIKEILHEIDVINIKLREKTGVYYTVNKNTVYNHREQMIMGKKRQQIRDNGTSERISAIQSAYKTKEQRLWLCETLEEAKEIVGV